MLIRKYSIVIACCLSLLVVPVLEAGWDDYRPDKIARIKQKYRDSFKDKEFVVLPGLAFRAEVIYLGKIRPIGTDRLLFIKMWGKSTGKQAMVIKIFKKEIMVKEDDRTYWLPIQNVLIPYLEKEVKINDKMTLYIGWAGIVKGDWVFLVNEFTTATEESH